RGREEGARQADGEGLMTNGGGGAGKPKPAFFVAILAVIAGLVGMAYWRCNAKKAADGGNAKTEDKIDIKDSKKQAGGGRQPAENPDPNGVTTTKEYTFEPATRLPEVPGTASYKALGKDRTVKFAVNVWAGWAPIIWANQGSKANKVWKDSKGGEFKVELALIDD